MKDCKRIPALIISLVMLLAVPVQAEEMQSPSDWAENDIIRATQLGLIPDGIQGGYQDNIKRYEYVLLALEILNAADIEIEVSKNYPFTDVAGHAYESEIIEAYNAGLIKGYEDGSFKPENEITRQEIASLVVNLVRVLEPDAVIMQKHVHSYSDKNTISVWASESIDYCFNNEIIKGVGEDASGRTIIQPLGQATVEQSEVMLLRFADSRNLISVIKYEPVLIGTDIPIANVDETVGDVYDDGSELSDELPAFSDKAGENITDIIYNSVDYSELFYDLVSEEMLVVTDASGDSIVCLPVGDNIIVTMELSDLSQGKLTRLYFELISTELTSDVATELFYGALRKAQDVVNGQETEFEYEGETIKILCMSADPDAPESENGFIYYFQYELGVK